jgi:hypothetical protein
VPLYIKYKPTDTGNRVPSPCATEALWLASSIWLTDTSNALIAKARVGTACRIHVQVDSSAETYAPNPPTKEVRVQVWVCNPSSGAGPTGGLASAGGSNGTTATTPFDPTNPAATVLAPGQPRTTYVEWTPQAGDLLGAMTESHLCIAANCYWVSNDPVQPAEGAALPPPGTVDICNNGHHAQRNISLLSATAPGSMSAEFMVAGGDEEGEPAEIFVQEVAGPRKLLIAELEQLLAEGIAVLAKVGEGERPKDADGEPYVRELLRRGAELVLAGAEDVPVKAAEEATAKAVLDSEHGSGRRLGLKLEPGRQAIVRLAIDLPEDDKPGVVRAFDVVQTGPKGQLVGGLRVLTVVAPGGFERQSAA